MKRPTFFEGVAVALTASLVGGALYAALTPAFGSGAVLRLLIAGVSFGYVVYLLTRSRGRIGRPTALATWAVVAGAGWLLGLSLPLYLAVHLGAVWLIRSLYFHASLLAALLDLGLNGLGLGALIWAATLSGSLFLSIWCFFLVQALFVAIPARMHRGPAHVPPARGGEDRFERAYRVAQSALRKLSSIR
jgi:hypothetical protein